MSQDFSPALWAYVYYQSCQGSGSFLLIWSNQHDPIDETDHYDCLWDQTVQTLWST